MSLYTLTFSDSSDSYDTNPPIPLPKRPYQDPQKMKRPIALIRPVRTIVHTVRIGEDKNQNLINSTSFPNPQPPEPRRIMSAGHRNSVRVSSHIARPIIRKHDFIDVHLSDSSNNSIDSPECSEESTEPIFPPSISKKEVSTNIQPEIPKSIITLQPEIETTHNSEINEIEAISPIPEKVSPKFPELLSYRVDRSNHGLSFLGKRLRFDLYQNCINQSQPTLLLTALSKGSTCRFIDPTNNHPIAIMKATEHNTHFIVYLKEDDARTELMSIQYKSYDCVRPRSMSLQLHPTVHNSPYLARFNPQNDFVPLDHLIFPEKLASKKPKKGPLGLWSLNYGKRKIISSIKNAILIDKNNNEYIIIGKVSDNSLLVEAVNGLHYLCVLAVAITSFLNAKP